MSAFSARKDEGRLYLDQERVSGERYIVRRKMHASCYIEDRILNMSQDAVKPLQLYATHLMISFLYSSFVSSNNHQSCSISVSNIIHRARRNFVVCTHREFES